MARVDGVVSVHDLHVWTLSGSRTALSAHVVVRSHGPVGAAARRAAVAAARAIRHRPRHAAARIGHPPPRSTLKGSLHAAGCRLLQRPHALCACAVAHRYRVHVRHAWHVEAARRPTRADVRQAGAFFPVRPRGRTGAGGRRAAPAGPLHAPGGLHPVGRDGLRLFHGPRAQGHAALPMFNQGELAVEWCFVFLFLAAAGPGAWSLDGLRRR